MRGGSFFVLLKIGEHFAYAFDLNRDGLKGFGRVSELVLEFGGDFSLDGNSLKSEDDAGGLTAVGGIQSAAFEGLGEREASSGITAALT